MGRKVSPFWRCKCDRLRLGWACPKCGERKPQRTGSTQELERLHDEAAAAVLDAAEPKEVH